MKNLKKVELVRITYKFKQRGQTNEQMEEWK